VRKGLLWLEGRAAHTETTLDDALIEALNRPLYVALVLLALNLWASMAPIPPVMQAYVATASQTIVVVLIILFADGRSRARSRTSSPGSSSRPISRSRWATSSSSTKSTRAGS